ncbi:MAG: SDR family NAD(P)-dependent oxidoreductase, partial [Kangiellaceae bacterium]|nr:SDR family NAD(P)-dependent oxidoreductase [Kangiellaceae bacterium]
IGSISGYISGASSGPYSMSKFAVEAYTEALAMDLQGSDVKVSVIEPGSYRSKIREKVTMHLMTGKYETSKNLTEEQKKRLEQSNQRNAQLKEPDEVSQAVLKFLSADKPKLRYMVVPDKQQAEVTIKTTLSRVVQLNADQPYEYTRDELVKMLDELLEKQKE